MSRPEDGYGDFNISFFFSFFPSNPASYFERGKRVFGHWTFPNKKRLQQEEKEPLQGERASEQGTGRGELITSIGGTLHVFLF